MPPLLVVTLLLALTGGVEAFAADTPHPEPALAVGYGTTAAGDPDRSYDYFPPREPGGATVFFVNSRFWSERPPIELVLRGFVRGLIQAGHGVVVLRHRSGDAAVHPSPIMDTARGFAHARERVISEGADRTRLFLVGHGSGAQLALQLTLDPQWLAPHALSPDAIAGVVSLSGILDLAQDAVRTAEEEGFVATAFPDPGDRAASSPMTLLDGDRPPILLLTAAVDVPGYAETAKRFVERARSVGRGPVERFVAGGRNHFTILDQSSTEGAPHLRDFVASRPASGVLPEMWQIAQTWRDPPFTTVPFHTDFPDLIQEYEADERFIEALNRPFRTRPGVPIRLRAQRYAAIDLVGLIDALAERGGEAAGPGGSLIATNVRGERLILPMARIRELAPRVVVGLDDERNLFRATDLYHTLRRYTWTEAEPSRVDMARPLGAFLYFPREEPTEREAQSLFGRYGLMVSSFRWVEEDPRAAFADLPELGREILTERHHCIACHRFRGVGGRALHLRARDAAPMGGHALPLERYPEVVWKRFVFEQRDVAAEVGADVVVFSPDEARALYQMVVEEREQRQIEPWLRPDRERLGPSSD